MAKLKANRWYHTNTMRTQSFSIGVSSCNAGAWYCVRIGRLSIAIIPH